MNNKIYAVLTGDIVKSRDLSTEQLKNLQVRLKLTNNIGENTDIDKVSVKRPIFYARSKLLSLQCPKASFKACGGEFEKMSGSIITEEKYQCRSGN